jgi:formate dehydrogenase iron-sulfur subunit
MSVRIFVPRDTTAAALGAEQVVEAIIMEAARSGIPFELVRSGSRGAYWLEPLVEVEDEHGRRAFGPVSPADVPGLFNAGFPGPCQHPLAQGDPAEIAWLGDQQRVTFARAGLTDPLSIKDYEAHGGFKGLRKALGMSGQAIVDEVKASGLRGRGGAAFPTGIKWQTVHDTEADQKFICCNADEGDSGTFADRMLMESDPYQLLEGMTIAGLAVGADQGYIYLRSEYPLAHEILGQAIEYARQGGFLGADVLGSGRAFNIEVRLGANAYICGEETSMLDSLEGKRGLVRFKPPLPAIKGLFQLPTVVNNVLSLAAVSSILADGGLAYHELGTGRSRGTITVQLGGNIRRGGLIEVPFGMSLRQVIDGFGGGTATGRPMRAIQVGGPLGTYLPESLWSTPLDYEAFAEAGGMLGHGGVVVFDDTVDLAEQARFAMEFCAVESCGKCTPCRVGSVRGMEIIDKIRNNQQREQQLGLLDELCETMIDGSLCAMGGLTPYPVRSALKHFPKDFGIARQD